MGKKILIVMIVGTFIYFPTKVLAQTGSPNQEYSEQLRALKEKRAQARTNYTQTKKNLQKTTQERLQQLGQSAEDLAERKRILSETQQERARLRNEYKNALETVKEEERGIKNQRREAHQAKPGETESGIGRIPDTGESDQEQDRLLRMEKQEAKEELKEERARERIQGKEQDELQEEERGRTGLLEPGTGQENDQGEMKNRGRHYGREREQDRGQE